ncbi:hypothetical protein BHE74_00000325 [Ensete ventricosum]|nr:hypothetical protein BHE74_00000325 [Ensete ventricosum]
MAIRLRTASFAMLLGLGASNAFAQSPAEFIEQASAKGMADIETSRMAHAKTSSQEIKDYTIEVINERTLANQHLAAIAKKLDLPVAPREKIIDKAETLMPELKDGDSFDAAYTAQQVKENEDAIALFKQEGAASDVGLVLRCVVCNIAAPTVQAHRAGTANAAVLLAQFFQLFAVQAIQAEHGILCVLGDAQQFVDLDVQDVVVTVLRVLDQEHHQERDDGGRGVDDQLPGVVVVEIRPAQAPHQNQRHCRIERARAACPAGQGLRDCGEFHDRFPSTGWVMKVWTAGNP